MKTWLRSWSTCGRCTPVKNPLPATQINFPVKYLVRSAAEPVLDPVPGPDPSDKVARGKYLVRMGCGCHNVVDNLGYAGGDHLAGPWGDVTSANLTPDASGISYFSEAAFITALRTGYVGARKAELHHALERIQEPHR